MPRHAVIDPDNPPLTDEELAAMRPLAEVLPALVKRRGRGLAKKASKRLVSLRLDPEVLDAYRRTGRGWQQRMHAALAAHAPTIKRARKASR